jgi:hypothetical protein
MPAALLIGFPDWESPVGRAESNRMEEEGVCHIQS